VVAHRRVLNQLPGFELGPYSARHFRPVNISFSRTLRSQPSGYHPLIRGPIHQPSIRPHFFLADGAGADVLLRLAYRSRRVGRTRWHERVEFLATDMLIGRTTQSQTLPQGSTRVLSGFCFFPHCIFLVGELSPNNLLTKGTLQPFKDTTNPFGPQPDSGQGGNLPGAHPLPEVEPEDHAIALLVRTR